VHHELIINPLADIFERIYQGKPASHLGRLLRKTPPLGNKLKNPKEFEMQMHLKVNQAKGAAILPSKERGTRKKMKLLSS